VGGRWQVDGGAQNLQRGSSLPSNGRVRAVNPREGNTFFPSAVFTSRDLAETWIERHKLHGTLTAYPLAVSGYPSCRSRDTSGHRWRGRPGGNVHEDVDG
jgi:hypothetical protein